MDPLKPFKPREKLTSRRYSSQAEADDYDRGYLSARAMDQPPPADAPQAYRDGWHDGDRDQELTTW